MSSAKPFDGFGLSMQWQTSFRVVTNVAYRGVASAKLDADGFVVTLLVMAPSGLPSNFRTLEEGLRPRSSYYSVPIGALPPLLLVLAEPVGALAILQHFR